ncbi:unnamed protein product, partial [Prunus brigantina]
SKKIDLATSQSLTFTSHRLLFSLFFFFLPLHLKTPSQSRTFIADNNQLLIIRMGKNVGSSSKAPATWNNHNISIFCDLCIKEVDVGRRPGTHFKKEGWENLRVIATSK